MRNSEKDIDLVAAFEAPINAGIRDIVVRELKGDLPSRTWPIRQFLIRHLHKFIVEPVMTFKDVEDLLAPYFAGALVTSLFLLTLFFGRVGCSWIVAGCPDITVWSSKFWLTRRLVPRHWQTRARNQRV